MASGIGSDVDDVVSSAYDFFVVFHDNDGVSDVAQPSEDADETFCVALVESDTGFVEDIDRAYQAASHGSGEVDALAFASGEGVRQAVEGKIRKSDIDEELEAADDFVEQAFSNGAFMWCKSSLLWRFTVVVGSSMAIVL